MSYLVLVIFLVLLTSLYCVFLGFKKTKDFKEIEETNSDNIHKESVCKKIEACWCSEYDLDEDKKEKVLKEFGDHNCGKTVTSIIDNG